MGLLLSPIRHGEAHRTTGVPLRVIPAGGLWISEFFPPFSTRLLNTSIDISTLVEFIFRTL